MQIVEQTKEEKIKMYMRCTKGELAEMLYNANLLLNKIPSLMYVQECEVFIPQEGTTAPNCIICGKSRFLHKPNNY